MSNRSHRLTARLGCGAALLGLAAGVVPSTALGQAAGSEPTAPTASSTPMAPAAASAPMTEAMERALRQSRSPYRWIIEAGKLRRRPNEAGATEAQAAAPAASPEAPRRAAAAEATPARVPAAPEVPARTVAAPAAGAELAPAPPAVSAPVAATPARPPLTLPVEPVDVQTEERAAAPASAQVGEAGPAAASVPGPSTATPAPMDPGPAPAAATAGPTGATPTPMAATPSPAADPVPKSATAAVEAPAAAEPEPEPASIRLVSMVEPQIPQRLLDEIAQGTEVTAELTLHADGSVRDVKLLQSLPRKLRLVLEEALTLWRYEPAATAGQTRTQRVQLVFGGNP